MVRFVIKIYMFATMTLSSQKALLFYCYLFVLAASMILLLGCSLWDCLFFKILTYIVLIMSSFLLQFCNYHFTFSLVSSIIITCFYYLLVFSIGIIFVFDSKVSFFNRFQLLCSFLQYNLQFLFLIIKLLMISIAAFLIYINFYYIKQFNIPFHQTTIHVQLHIRSVRQLL